MKKIDNMKKSVTSSIVLSVIILFSFSIIFIPSNGYAEEINVKSMGVEKTSIITFTNEGTQDVKTFRIWLSQDAKFESFKTEKGWIGEKNSQGVIVFSSSESIKENQSVKFGIKTDKPNPVINWKGLDITNSVINTGVISTDNIQKVNQNPTIDLDKNNSDGEIFLDSTFRIIPDKPNPGSTIRVTGNSFEALQNFDFYIDELKIGNFETDESGFFITTMEIPKNVNDERVNFKVKNDQGQEKIFSLRLGEKDNRISEIDKAKLSVDGINNIVYQGDNLNLFGEGNPKTSITIEILDPEGVSTDKRTSTVDSTGKWELDTSIFIPFDAKFGKYSIIISDGQNQILKNWKIESNKKINISPTSKIFEAGGIIEFSGNVIPNIPIEFMLEDSFGNQKDSKVLTVDETGLINYQFQTTENEDVEGTWVLISTQGKEKEFSYVGYDEVPNIPIKIEFDKINYKQTDTAKINLLGEPSDIIKIIIINPTGGIAENDISIVLSGDGKASHELDLTGYTSGIYSAVVKKGNSQNSEQFSVGLQIGSGPIEISTTQISYEKGDKILLLGNAKPNSLLITALIDPSGKEIKRIETPTNNDGKFSEDKLTIPINAITGNWKIVVSSGPNLSVINIPLLDKTDKLIDVNIKDQVIKGEIVKINVSTSFKTTIILDIFDQNGNELDLQMSCNTTKDFICETFWQIPDDMIIGTYTIKATDGENIDEKEFEILE